MKNKTIYLLIFIFLVIGCMNVFGIDSPNAPTGGGSNLNGVSARIDFNYTGSSDLFQIDNVSFTWGCGAGNTMNMDLFNASGMIQEYNFNSAPSSYTLSPKVNLSKGGQYSLNFSGTNNCWLYVTSFTTTTTNDLTIAMSPVNNKILTTNGGATYPQFKFSVFNISGVPPSSNFSVTAFNSWNNAQINNFSVQMQNRTNYLYFNTTNNTLYTNILQNSTTLWNLTYFANTTYFYKTYLNVNVSSNHVAVLNQSIINITLKNIIDNSTISNYSVYFNTTLFCNTSTTNCVNYPITGFYFVNLSGNFHYLASNTTINILDNKTLFFYPHTYQINVTAFDVVTNTTINNFNINIKSLNTSYEANYTTTTGIIEAYAIQNTYNITIDATGYALYNNNKLSTINITDNNVIFYLYRSNGISINIFNEVNGSSLNGTDVTIYTYINTTLINTITTNNGTYSFYNLTPENYTFRFEATNYAVKEYYVEIGNRSFQYLNAYMLQTTYQTIFSLLDETTGNTIEGASIIVERYINGTLQIVSSLSSDITGRIQLNFQQNTPYYFTITKTGYTTKQFVLNPILFSSYNVKLFPTTTQTYEADYSGVTIVYNPNYLTNGQTNSLSFSFGSPAGKLVNYGYNITYGTQFNSSTDNNAYGSTLLKTISITGATTGSKADVYYFYETSDGAINTYYFKMDIVGTQTGNYTIFSNKGKTYGLGTFERILIVTIITILVAGAGAMFSGAFIGAFLGMFILCFFAYMGFISWWAVYPTGLILFVYMVWGSSR